MPVFLTETSSASSQPVLPWDWDEIHPTLPVEKSDQLSVNMLKEPNKLGQIVKFVQFFRFSAIESVCPSESFHATNHMEAIEGVIVPQTISKRSACRTIKLAIAEVTVIKSCGLLTLQTFDKKTRGQHVTHSQHSPWLTPNTWKTCAMALAAGRPSEAIGFHATSTSANCPPRNLQLKTYNFSH